jgi:hypothetical protein
MNARAEIAVVLDQLPDVDVERLLVEARARLEVPPPAATVPFAWARSIKNGPRNASSPEAIAERLAQGFGRDPS